DCSPSRSMLHRSDHTIRRIGVQAHLRCHHGFPRRRGHISAAGTPGVTVGRRWHWLSATRRPSLRLQLHHPEEPMKAAVYVGDPKTLALENLTPNPPGPRDVVVEIGASGVCHSDLSIMRGYVPVPPGMVLGHEGAGKV